jgi:Ca-activated chloride channel homolog
MRKLIAVVAFSLAVALTLYAQTPAESAPDDPFTLKVDVDLVLFNVTVQDRKGNLVSGLDIKDFKIYEEGQEQEINFFRPENIPATVGLVIDNSGSMIPKRPEVIEAGLAFAKASNPQDQVFIVNFNEHVSMGLPPSIPFTSDFNQLQRSLRAIGATGRTALYDALIQATHYLEQGRHQRKALVVLSDGGDNASRSSLESALAELQNSDATVYTIGIYDPHAKDKNPGVLKKIAKVGGGESYFPNGGIELARVWERIAGGIRSQYTLGFTSRKAANDVEYRRVVVRATDKDGKPLRVRTREGYRPPAVNADAGPQ